MEQQSINWREMFKEWEKNHPKKMPEELRELREEFLRRFPLEKLPDLTLEEYALGQKNKDNFCTWIEFRTKDLLGIGGGSVAKHGIWWNKKESRWQWNKYLNCETAEQAFIMIKNGLIELVNAAKSKQFDLLDEIASKYPNSNLVRAKVLYLYFPDEFLPIASPDHLWIFLKMFDIEIDEGFHTQNRQLLEFFRDQPEFKDYDIEAMSRFLYDCFDPRNNSQDETTTEDNKIENTAENESMSKQLETITQIASQSRNIILYGVPGTGKTYLAKKFADAFLSPQVKTPLSPEQNRKEVLQNLTWYEALAITLYLNKNRKSELTATEITKDPIMVDYGTLKKSQRVYHTIQNILQSHTHPNVKTVNIAKRSEPYWFSKTKDLKWFLTDEAIEEIKVELPSQIEALTTSQSKIVDISKYLQTVTFHQSFSYEEFIEGIKPITDDSGNVTYETKDGIFKEICRQAEQDPDHNYILIIDEINRANISKVFGELMTLIEDDKRLGKEKELTVKLPYSQETFGIPNNLYIIATMNTADRSIALIDIALRRRFTFISILPDPSLLSEIEGIDLSQLLTNLNQKITLLLGEDYQIGHSYFFNINTLDNLYFIWYYRIIPLLKEYFYNDWRRLQVILGNQFIKKEPIPSHLIEQISEFTDIEETYKIQELTGQELINAFQQLTIHL